MDSAARETIANYFSCEKIRKLHLGCGEHILEGWLNTDLVPRDRDVLVIDASKPFPFDTENGMFDYIFSEHMIEHLDYAQGYNMLSECHRVLNPGGRLRISTPNLSFLIDLYKLEKSEIQRDYIEWATDRFIETAPCYADTFVINNFVRDWGHRFIYDEKILIYSLTKVGFQKIVKCDLNKSNNDVFRNLENNNRIPVEFLKLESIILEAAKPPIALQEG